MKERFLRNDTAVGIALALTAFAVYLATLAPTVLEEDRGELATALYTLGVAHPTGYPLFTLLGWVFAHLPLGDARVIWKLNLMVALCCAAAAFVFHRLFLHLLREGLPAKAATIAPRRKKDVPQGTTQHAARGDDNRLAAAAATLVLAFSRIYWSNALALEVYALHLLFLALVTWLFLRAMGERSGTRAWLLFAYVLGLSFANHMMTVLLAPAFLYLYFTVHGFGKAAWRKIAAAAPLFLLGLTPYLYLPLRAAHKPLMNWGEPATLETFWRHVSGGQYRVRMFSSADVAFKKLGEFFTALPAEFGYLPLAFAAVGLWFLFRRARAAFTFTVLLFAGCLFYAVNYDFIDPNFYLNAHFAVAVWVLWGMRVFLEHAWARGWSPRVAGAACLALALFPLAANYRAVDQSRNYAVEDYANNVFASVDSNALVLSNQFAYLTSAAYYLQLVEGVRPDIILLDESLLKRPWYYLQIARRHPGVIDGAGSEIAAFLRAEGRMEKGDPATHSADSAIAVRSYVALIGALLGGNERKRPLYVTLDVTDGMPSNSLLGLSFVPTGMVFRLMSAPPDPPLPYRELAFRPLPKTFPRNGKFITYPEYFRNNYALAYANQGLYRLTLGDSAFCAAQLRKALELRPLFPEVSGWLNLLESRGY